MRMMIALPLLLLGACQVNVDDDNDAASVEYDQNLAEETVADVSNQAEQIGGHISNDVQETGQQVDEQLVVDEGQAETSN